MRHNARQSTATGIALQLQYGLRPCEHACRYRTAATVWAAAMHACVHVSHCSYGMGCGHARMRAGSYGGPPTPALIITKEDGVRPPGQND